ncbi:MAG: hypothetical protein ACL7BU_05965 [Candidatus Phlomobacter fragariae]
MVCLQVMHGSVKTLFNLAAVDVLFPDSSCVDLLLKGRNNEILKLVMKRNAGNIKSPDGILIFE